MEFWPTVEPELYFSINLKATYIIYKWAVKYEYMENSNDR